MDFLQPLIDQLKPELWNLVALLVSGLLVMGLKSVGMNISAGNDLEFQTLTRKGIQLAREENARRVKNHIPRMTSAETLAYAKDYVAGELDKRKSKIASFLLSWVMSSFSRPNDAAIETNVVINLESMDEGSAANPTPVTAAPPTPVVGTSGSPVK